MGPFSDTKQFQRAEAIKRVLESPNLSKEMRAMWNRKLIGLALTEDEYVRRVKEVYSSPAFKPIGIINNTLGGNND